MQHELEKIVMKPSDYKVCKCGSINWYENDVCVSTDCVEDQFDVSEEAVQKWIDNEYRFWKEEGYSEEEVDLILIEI